MSGIFSDGMSISVYIEGSTVGKLSGCWEYIIVEEKRKNLFPKSLMSATIQDGSIREGKNVCFYFSLF